MIHAPGYANVNLTRLINSIVLTNQTIPTTLELTTHLSSKSECSASPSGAPYLHTCPGTSTSYLSREKAYFESFHIYDPNQHHPHVHSQHSVFPPTKSTTGRQQFGFIYFYVLDEKAKHAFLVLRTIRRLRRIKFRLPIITRSGYAALRGLRGMESVNIECELHSSKRVEAMKIPRLPRFQSLKDPEDIF